MLGRFKSTLNEKGRMNFPSKFREALGESFIIARHFQHRCLTVYSTSDFQELSDKIDAAGYKMEAYRRIVLGNAYEVDPDKQGRLVIPPDLREYAGLEVQADGTETENNNGILIIGQGRRAEIWNKKNFDDFTNSINTEDIAAMMNELGL